MLKWIGKNKKSMAKITILLALLLVSSGIATPSTDQDSVKKLALKISKDPEIYSIPSRVAELMGLSDGTRSRALGVELADSSDNMSHGVELLYEVSSSSKMVPFDLMLYTTTRGTQTFTQQYFRVGLDGRLKKAFKVLGKFDDTGQEVRGSGEVTHFSVDESAARMSFQHELDFWLKGAFRKNKRAAAKPSKATEATERKK